MKIVWTIFAVSLLAVIALGVHIYVVKGPRVEGHSRGMARIDLHQSIGRPDVERITAWLSGQRGVDHVVVGQGSAIVVFTYWPGKANPAVIVKSFRASMPYPGAERYLPSAAEERNGCPMTATRVTNSIYEFLKRIF